MPWKSTTNSSQGNMSPSVLSYPMTTKPECCYNAAEHKKTTLKPTLCQVQVDKYLYIKPDTLNLIEEKVGKSLKYMGTGENS